MWTLVSGGPKTLWVKTEECRLANGERAFVDDFGDPPTLPEWYVDLPGSTLRDTWDARTGGEQLWKHLSGQVPSERVVNHYLQQVSAGGLELESEEFGRDRMSPGFSAKSELYGFSIDVYERNGLSFWTTGLETVGYEQTKWIPNYLQYVAEQSGVICLRETGLLGKFAKECWAPLEAIRDTEPPIDKPHATDTQQILWSSLPDWFQFDVTANQRARVTIYDEASGTTSWIVNLSLTVEGEVRSIIEHCLDALDKRGFDGSGLTNSERSYYISSLSRGRWLAAHIKSQADEAASVGISESGDAWKLHFSFRPPSGTSFPSFVEWVE